ncbi:MAG: hypothetical protein GEU78_16090 [Actinobacteria bacterium]|nr:hypothetical protein [Actinomycetota bacterium]
MAGSLEGFVGRFGAGKTLLMTWRAYKAQGNYDELWSNYTLVPEFFPKVELHKFTTGDEFFAMIRNALDRVDGRPGGIRRLLVIDEIHSLFDARAWAQLPLEALTPLSQLRKAGLTILYTSQHESQVEKRIRNYTNFMWLCRSWGRDFNILRDAPLVFWATAYDNFEFRRPGAEKLGSVVFRVSKKKARLYDTFEVVERMSMEGLGTNALGPDSG